MDHMAKDPKTTDNLTPSEVHDRYRRRAAKALRDTLLDPHMREGRFRGCYSSLCVWTDEAGTFNVRDLTINGRLLVNRETDEWELTDSATTPTKKKSGMEVYGPRIRELLADEE